MNNETQKPAVRARDEMNDVHWAQAKILFMRPNMARRNAFPDRRPRPFRPAQDGSDNVVVLFRKKT